MKVYKDNTKTEIIADLSEEKLLPLLLWESMSYNRRLSTISVPIKIGCDEMFDIIVAAASDFGTEFYNICSDSIALCIDTKNAECTLYIDDGINDDLWGYIELSNNEFFEITNQAYIMKKGM